MKYSITYTDLRISHVKTLVSHDLFVEMRGLEKELSKKGQKEYSEEIAIMEKRAKELKTELGENFFTDQSPLWEASRTGVLVTPHCQLKCKIEAIDEKG